MTDCVATDPSHGRGGQEWCATHGQLLSHCRAEPDPEPCPDWCAYHDHEHTAVRRRDPDDVARKLLDDAFFLRQNGENAPGYRNRTWRDWEMQVEVYLRTVAHFQAKPPDPDRLARAEALLAQIARVDAPARWRQTIHEQGFA